MGERTKYTQGTFSWTDLNTTDQQAAKAFYSGVFGWETEDLPVGDGVSYTMASIGGKNVAAISPQPQQQRDAGVPPAWNSYITVENADQAAERAAELGATVHAQPFDVMDAGRMAVIQDPQGAWFLIWEAEEQHRRIARKRPRRAVVERAGDTGHGRVGRSSTGSYSIGRRCR